LLHGNFTRINTKIRTWERMFYTPLEFCVTHSEEKLEVIFSST